MDYTEYIKQQSELNEVKQAGVRCWAVVLGHLLLPPFSSLYYAIKTNYWKPTVFATGVAAVCFPISFVDAGITIGIAPPATSAAMIIANTTEKRRKLKLFMPEQADHLRFELEKNLK